ncbi:hypothetical protein Xen7305DRAFT_00008740 [Xenococcus sp. PCC 7305]|uniref:hypothetical protein n=1 Tax=Xenococcus sp. PCC 7305 TaxID=102125 RepID=UPI0002ABEDFA|nr:hypothetical protein [Xenococcus sp. PCC 7305]ELS01172.1 hypothetical protein Xen7305DRAFT_00008740 [Xenococcus sp. PCC 7305]
MGKLNKIVFPLPTGLKAPFNILENGALFNGDTLVLPVNREDYNAPNPKSKEIKEGVTSAVADLRVDYYKPEFTSRDSRSIIKDVLEALEAVGNLDTAGITLSDQGSLDLPPVIMHDYHRYDGPSDRTRGYTIRVGVFSEIEDLKGSFRGFDGTTNYNGGTRVAFTHIFNIVGGSLVDARSR